MDENKLEMAIETMGRMLFIFSAFALVVIPLSIAENLVPTFLFFGVLGIAMPLYLWLIAYKYNSEVGMVFVDIFTIPMILGVMLFLFGII